jgi:hypothetical protein
MEYLVILYFIDLTFGSVGQGRVSRQDLATWLMKSKPTIAKIMQKMIDARLVNEHRVSALKGHGFIVKYSMTVEGKRYLDENFDAAYQQYRIHVAKVLQVIEDNRKESSEYRKLTAKEKRQIEAGQKEMF